MTNDITQVQNFLSQFVRGMIRNGMLMFGSMFCMFQLDRTFGWIVLCAFPFIVGCLILCMVKANPLFTRLQAELDEINAILQEDIAGIRIIKACVREVYEKLRLQGHGSADPHAAKDPGDLRLPEPGDQRADVRGRGDSPAGWRARRGLWLDNARAASWRPSPTPRSCCTAS